MESLLKYIRTWKKNSSIRKYDKWCEINNDLINKEWDEEMGLQ